MHAIIVRSPQHQVDLIGGDHTVTKAEHLFEQRLAVTHRSGSPPCDQFQSCIIGLGDSDSEEAAEVAGEKSLLGGFDLKGLMSKKDKADAEAE